MYMCVYVCIYIYTHFLILYACLILNKYAVQHQLHGPERRLLIRLKLCLFDPDADTIVTIS